MTVLQHTSPKSQKKLFASAFIKMKVITQVAKGISILVNDGGTFSQSHDERLAKFWLLPIQTGRMHQHRAGG